MQRYYMLEHGKTIDFSNKPFVGNGSLMILNEKQIDHEKVLKGYLYNGFYNGTVELKPSKSILIEGIYEKFNTSLSIIESKYTTKERETFELKRQEAEKVIAGGESAFLSALCLEGETVSDLANKIKANSEAYQLLYAQSERDLRQKLKYIKNKYN